jgi:hypothetical protein
VAVRAVRSPERTNAPREMRGADRRSTLSFTEDLLARVVRAREDRIVESPRLFHTLRDRRCQELRRVAPIACATERSAPRALDPRASSWIISPP